MITPDGTAPSGEPQVDSAPRRRLGSFASRSWPPAVLALLCYVPALLAHPGQVPADTKLYLYLDPGGLMRAAPRAWDPTQYGGWVPHQTISYLWPSGPWYWIFDKLGVPDWIAQRLWIATLLLCAGLGAMWLAKVLGLKPPAAMVTALFYMLSPYILPYISRTSLMLLPFSGLCWLIGLTIKAATGSSWRAPALFALVMFTVAAPNFTAIVMVAPGPILWLVDAVWRRTITFRAAAVTSAKLVLLSLVVSLWWVVMLAIQSKHGANVLGFSETLQAVSFTSSSTETLRGLGYWLFYIRDLGSPATSAATAYLTSSALVLVTLVVLIGGFAGLTIIRWGARRYAALLVFAGTILAISVHPIDDASPLMSPLADASRSGLALSMRSSTRALPLSVLGFALGWGALVTVLTSARLRWPMRWRTVVLPIAAGLLAVVNLPALFTGDIADPAISHQENPPNGWASAAAALSLTPKSARVLQLPGAPFGAYRWGYTVDPVLPGLTDKPFLDRDLLPLGSPGAMDLLYAIDNRFQSGTVEASSIAPVARLLGADSIFSPDDVAFDRFRTPRPELTNRILTTTGVGLGTTTSYGAPTPNTPSLAMIDEDELSNPLIGTPLPTATVTQVPGAAAVIRAKSTSVVVVGSGDGLVDAAAAGLIDGSQLVRYAADLAGPTSKTVPGASLPAEVVIVTDSNRDRAEQWRSSRDTLGFTEDGTANGSVAVLDSADARLAVFPGQTAADQTIAEQRGGLTAVASAYGEPYAYRPEDRAFMAVDDNPATAWLVADRAPADGAFITVASPKPVSRLTLVQPNAARTNRWITSVSISYGHGPEQIVALDASSRTGSGQTVTAPTPFTTATINIRSTSGDGLNPFGESAVGFATISASAADGSAVPPTIEVVRPPVTMETSDTGVAAAVPVVYVFTRERTSATDRWRSDPEPALVREVRIGSPVSLQPTITVRLDQRADDSILKALFGTPDAATASDRLTGVAADGGYAAVDGNPKTSWVSSFGHFPGQQAGGTLTVPLDPGTTIGQLRLTQSTDPRFATIRSIAVSSDGGRSAETVSVPAPDASGVSTVNFSPVTTGSISITIASTDAKTTIDRRSAEPTSLPFSIEEISGAGIRPVSLPATIDTGCRTDLLSFDAKPIGLQITATTSDLLAGKVVQAKLCGAAQGSVFSGGQMAKGNYLVVAQPGSKTGLDIDRLVLAPPGTGATVRSAGLGAPTVTSDSTHDGEVVTVSNCASGCWLTNGEGYEPGWTAKVSGVTLDTPIQVDGGFDGWWLPPGPATRTVTLAFGPQRTLDIALLLTATGVLACIAMALGLGRRRRSTFLATGPRPLGLRATSSNRFTALSIAFAWLATSAVGAVVISPEWGVITFVVSGVLLWTRRRPEYLGIASLAWICVIAVRLFRILRQVRPAPDPTWTSFFETLHRPALLAVVLLFGSVMLDRQGDSGREPEADRELELDRAAEPRREPGTAPWIDS